MCHGKRGTIHQAHRNGMEDQLGALGLVLIAIVLWTTKCIEAAVVQLRNEVTGSIRKVDDRETAEGPSPAFQTIEW